MIKKLSHIGIVVQNIEEATKLWTETYGLKVSHGGNAAAEGIKNVFLKAGDNYIELMEPVDHQDMNNAVARRLATKGEGVYHIALIVDDVSESGKEMASRGVTIFKRPASEDQPQGRILVHPKNANGAMLEFLSQ
jgi:methylmalonyl-CoA/ethylmalonyl-CoA epimerase